MQYSKLKTLLIYNILEKYSDEEHPLSTTDLISMLEKKGVKCERKSIYADIAALNDIGCDIITVTSPKRGFFMASRTFEIPEVMLMKKRLNSFIAGVALTCKTVKNILKKRLPSLRMLLFGRMTIITLSAIIKNTIIL